MRQVKLFDIGKVFEQLLFEVVFAPDLIWLVTLCVTVFAPMTAAGINIDTIAMAAGKFFLVGKWTIPFNNAGPCNINDLLI
jgi:hypothetical protein